MSDKISRRDLLKLSLTASTAGLVGLCSKLDLQAAEPLAFADPGTPIDGVFDVIVVGGGISGLAAARLLQGKGAKVVILEARDRIGGRVWTVNSIQGVSLDLGAQWIEGITSNPIASLARSFNLRTLPTDFDNEALYDAQGRRVSGRDDARIDKNYESIIANVEKLRDDLEDDDADDISLKQGIDRVLAGKTLSNTERTELNFSINTEIEHDYGADVSDLSLSDWDQDEEFGGDSVIFPGGYGQIAAGLAKGLDIRLGQHVKNVQYDDREVRVRTDKGTFTAKRAIVTLPLGVLKRGNVSFSPGLPSRKVNAIHSLKMGILNKVYLRFPRVFWDKEDLLGYISTRKGEFTEWVNFQKYTSQPILLAFNAGDFGRQIEALSNDEIIRSAMQVLRTIYGSSIPAPIGTLITRWGSDPFTYGSYSHIPPGASGEDYDAMAEPVVDRIFFAGEATSRTYAATVHGAFLAGEREAKRISKL